MVTDDFHNRGVRAETLIKSHKRFEHKSKSSLSTLKARNGGPSGVLITPKGGTVFNNHLGNVGNVEVIYKGVSDGSNEFGARTCTIDLHLVPVGKSSNLQGNESFNLSSSSVMNLAYGMRPHDSGSSQPIWANFAPPVEACGDYHLVVYERQLFENTVIHFQSAAPVISFKCAQAAPKIYPIGAKVDLF
ncbi:hypothetical protein BY996DRAFT_4580034 [Phakopsora pachyrhizi]|nr:hypothetical protein BY996DRAFT_4605016 [Phakopsora pachyrhizi]KAI8456109.1 hypothetical protein BY996DRAFT_4580034 [Phakopsora pachyrhizi]